MTKRTLGLLPLISVMYLVVSGGAYGLEDAVRLAGPRLTILLCLIVPLTLSVPDRADGGRVDCADAGGRRILFLG